MGWGHERERCDAGGAEDARPRPKPAKSTTSISTVSTLKRSSTGIGFSWNTIADLGARGLFPPGILETIDLVVRWASTVHMPSIPAGIAVDLCPLRSRLSEARLVRPYHQWTDNLEELSIARSVTWRARSRRRYRAQSVHCEASLAISLSCVAPAAPSFEPFRAQAERVSVAEQHRQRETAFESTIVENGNWETRWKTTASVT